MTKDAPVDYDFKDVSPSDYELEVLFHVKGSKFDYFFTKVREAYMRKKALDLGKRVPSYIQEFEVVSEYHNYLGVVTKKQLKIIYKEIAKNNIAILSSKVDKGRFKKDQEGMWHITVLYKGQYVRK